MAPSAGADSTPPRATALLQIEPELFLANLRVTETVHVLELFYETPREQVAQVVSGGQADPRDRPLR